MLLAHSHEAGAQLLPLRTAAFECLRGGRAGETDENQYKKDSDTHAASGAAGVSRE
jgi:hypothetical protein